MNGSGYHVICFSEILNLQRVKATYKSLSLRVNGVFLEVSNGGVAYRAKLYNSWARAALIQQISYKKMHEVLLFYNETYHLGTFAFKKMIDC